jgi:hypothetical protein
VATLRLFVSLLSSIIEHKEYDEEEDAVVLCIASVHFVVFLAATERCKGNKAYKGATQQKSNKGNEA